jgi:hypothetical protein
MLLFSPGGRRVIEVAVDQFADPPGKRIWHAWARQHTRVRRAGDPWDDGGAPLPRDVVETVLFALNEMARAKRHERESARTEDDVASLDNDLSRIKAVIRLLTEGPPARQPMVA